MTIIINQKILINQKVKASLMFDSVNLLGTAFERIFTDKPLILNGNFWRDDFYISNKSDNFKGIDCSKQYPIIIWQHGQLIIDYLKSVIIKFGLFLQNFYQNFIFYLFFKLFFRPEYKV